MPNAKGEEKEKRQKQIEYTEERKTLISMGNGPRTLNIASLNPDSMKGEETQQEITNKLTRNKIHIAMIQETNISEDRIRIKGIYRIITAASERHKGTGIATGGTAIMIHESLQKNITQIVRQSSRAVKVTQHHHKAKMPTQIISTYAPHNGHNEEVRNQHWEDVQELLNKTCKRHLIYGGQTQVGN